MMVENNFESLKKYLNSGTKNAKLAKIVLATIMISSLPVILVGSVTLGNSVQILNLFKNKKYKKKQIFNALNYLKNRRMVEYVSDQKGITTVRVTRNGEEKIKSFSIDILKIEKQKKWDGKWRLVMFDLPVKYNRARGALRFKLKQMGFLQFQKSAWLYPYPCIDEILFVSDYYKIGDYVKILEVSSILDDYKVRKYFNLNKL